MLTVMPTEINLTPTGSPFEIASEGQAITGKTWGTASGCRAAALLVHGIGAHSGWFEALARRLKVKQIYALAYDQSGFGKRRNVKLSSYQQWLDDLKIVYRHLKEQVGDKPIFLMGNSMGGVVAACAAPAVDPSGLVLFSPGFEGNMRTFTPIFRIMGMLQAILQPDSEIDLPYGSDAFILEKSTRTWVDSDPDARFRVPAGMLLQLLKLTQQVPQRVRLIKCSTLMITAGLDRIIDNKAAAGIFAKLNVPHKKRRHFVDAYHDLLFDPAIDDLTKEVTDWISERTSNVGVEV